MEILNNGLKVSKELTNKNSNCEKDETTILLEIIIKKNNHFTYNTYDTL